MPYPLNHLADAQLPASGDIFIDHIAFFVDQMPASALAMEQLGFQLTPYTPQSNAAGPGKPDILVGLANQCIMLQRGYVEILAIHKETGNPLIEQHRDALSRHTGLHLLAFSTDTPEQFHKHLDHKGFSPLPPVALRRTVDTSEGEKELRFHVQRIALGQMPEGRVQALKHLTPDALWQKRWMSHPNGATALTDLLLCTDDLPETVERYERFTGLAPFEHKTAFIFVTGRGRLTVADPEWILDRLPGIALPPRPAFVACALAANLSDTRQHLDKNDIHFETVNDHGLWTVGPPEPGGIIAFADDLNGVAWLHN